MKLVSFGVGVFLIVAEAFAAKPPRFSIMEIGSFPDGSYSSPTKLNNKQQIIGRADTLGWFVPFVWEDGVMAALPVPRTAHVGSMNDRGQFVGADGWNFVGNVTFPGPPSGFSTASGRDINNAGQFVGTVTATLGLGPRAYRCESNIVVLLGDNRDSGASAISERGKVVGWATTETGNVESAYLVPGKAVLIGGLPNALASVASDINDHGDVVGISYYAQYWHGYDSPRAFEYRNGKLRAIGTLPGHEFSQALAMNNSRETVGGSFAGDGSYPRAFLEVKGKLYDLNDLVPQSIWKLDSAVSINQEGWIAVAAHSHTGPFRQEALLLKPEKHNRNR